MDVCFGGLGADDQAPESTGPHSMVSEFCSASMAPLSLEDARARLTGCSSQAQASRRLGQVAEPAGVPAARFS